MTLAIVTIILGFIGLIWSADRFVEGAAALAKNLGMTPIMIGLTIVSIGTSAPEIIVSISAAFNQSGALAVGNALGSNLANIGLVLGITAVMTPIPIARRLLRRELPILIVATVAASYCLIDGALSRIDGIILLLALCLIFTCLVKSKSHQPDAEHLADVEHIPDVNFGKAWLLFLFGLGLLIISSQALVWGAKTIAIDLGISELVIGLTVIAVGTSLPELAATVASALKGHHDLAIGNILGSNLFNLLAVMALPGLIAPVHLAPEVFYRDYGAMTAITLLLAAMLYGHRLLWSKASHSLGRIEGSLLLLAYAAYYYFLFSVQG
jgi:cation:H+ antiporter